jgi:hypothetical protein
MNHYLSALAIYAAKLTLWAINCRGLRTNNMKNGVEIADLPLF